MKKNIILFSIFIFSFFIESIHAQKKMVLFKNDTLTFIHDTYESQINSKRNFRSVLYVSDNRTGKVDTLGTPNGWPIGKAYYDGEYFTTILRYIGVFSPITFVLCKKINGKWRTLANYDGSLDQPKRAIYLLEQTDIFTLQESLTGYYPEPMVSELKVDTRRKAIVRYNISKDGRKEEVESYPFPDYRY